MTRVYLVSTLKARSVQLDVYFERWQVAESFTAEQIRVAEATGQYRDARREAELSVIDVPFRWTPEIQDLVVCARDLRVGDRLAGATQPVGYIERDRDGIAAWLGDGFERWAACRDDDEQERIAEECLDQFDHGEVLFLTERGPEPAANPGGRKVAS